MHIRIIFPIQGLCSVCSHHHCGFRGAVYLLGEYLLVDLEEEEVPCDVLDELVLHVLGVEHDLELQDKVGPPSGCLDPVTAQKHTSRAVP